MKHPLLVVIALAGTIGADGCDRAGGMLRSAMVDEPVHASQGSMPGPIADAGWLRRHLGLDGAGIGVATIDSGIAPGHDDLRSVRVVHWADFVNHLPAPYDDYGHGTHVAGIIAGSRLDAQGSRGALAPGVDLIVLKALDGTGNGRIRDVVAAVDYAVAHRDRYNIRVINLSVAAGVYESHRTDPLAQAALRAVQAGIVVVAAAGNFGLRAGDEPQAGSIAGPGNAPWVLTVGASDDRGTASRSDDVVAAFSSRGPSAIDGTPKPDLLAPGVGVESAADPGSTLFATQWRARTWRVAGSESHPYLRLSGTSMAAPSVTATIALMLQAVPALTPNAVKAILQLTAEPRAGAAPSTQGAGVLNGRGAVGLARSMTARPADLWTLEQEAGGTASWGRQILWGERHITGDRLPLANPAWDPDVTWGSNTTPRGDAVTWEGLCESVPADCQGR